MKEAQKIIEDTLKDIEDVQAQIDEINRKEKKSWETILLIICCIVLAFSLFGAWYMIPKKTKRPHHEQYVNPPDKIDNGK
jgi:flagellar basal body-associated protein FliL